VEGRLGKWKTYFVRRVENHWNRLSKEVPYSPSLKVFIIHLGSAMYNLT